MPKPISWSDRAYEIRERVKHSHLQTWRRQDLETIFEIKRASVQSLMKVIGDIHTIGATHFVERASLLAFLDEAVQADRVGDVVSSRQIAPEPVPSKQRLQDLKVPLPEDFKSLMAKDLPANIQLSSGSLRIEGEGAIDILQGRYLLAQAFENDLDTMRALLDPPLPPPKVEDDELREMFDRLRQEETIWAEKQRARGNYPKTSAWNGSPRGRSWDRWIWFFAFI